MAGRKPWLVPLLAVHMVVLHQCSMASAETASAFVKRVVHGHPVVIFSKSYCPYCKRAKSVFHELHQTPFVVELDEREDGWDIQRALSELVGRRTVPQVFVHGKHIGGSDDTVEGHHNGKLAKLLSKKSEL